MKKQFTVLAIYEVHPASAALMIDGCLIAATHEERFTRLKNDGGYPKNAVEYCLSVAGITSRDLDKVVILNEAFDANGVANILFKRMARYSVDDWITENKLFWKPKLVDGDVSQSTYFDLMGGWDRVATDHHYDTSGLDLHADSLKVSEKFNEIRRSTVANHLGLSPNKVEFVKHYPCHHYHAFYSKPDRSFDSVIVHAEGDGGGCNMAVSLPSTGGLEFISRTNGFNLGRLYQWMTLYLGMKPYHHEYKLMGLAPHASPWEIEKTLAQFEPFFRVDHQTMTIEFDEKPKDLFFTFAERLLGHRFDGIAGALQKLLELRLCEWVECVAQRTNRKNILYGGGVAMNIKANGTIAKSDAVENLFVPLSPADESNVIGACYWETEKHFLEEGRPLNDIQGITCGYWGKEYSQGDIDTATEKYRESGSPFAVHNDIGAAEVAQLLNRGYVVARHQGRSEFGQRALGNRSILASPKADGVLQKINTQIKNRDFWMPFAPSVLAERAGDYLVNPKGLDSPFMTIGFESTDEGRKSLPQALHPADQTARPQILTREANAGYHTLISEFEKLSGVGALLNTSFNLHGEPIVDSPSDAVSVFERSKLDALWMDGTLLSRDGLEL